MTHCNLVLGSGPRRMLSLTNVLADIEVAIFKVNV
jgi:hypothetical protein